MSFNSSSITDNAPWKKDVPWQLLTIEGIVAALIGLFLIWKTDTASTTVMYLLAIILVVYSVLDVIGGWQSIFSDETRNSMDAIRLIRGGSGASVGVLALLAERSDYITTEQARVILGYGLLVFGILGVVGIILSGLFGSHRWSALLANVLVIAVGAVIVFANWRREDYSESQIIQYIGWACLIGGILLAIYGGWFKREEESTIAETASYIAGNRS